MSQKKDIVNKDIMRDLEEAEGQLEEMRRAKDALEVENGRLRDEVSYMEGQLAKAQRRPTSSQSTSESATAMMMVRRENEQLKGEVRSLKERITCLNQELEALASA